MVNKVVKSILLAIPPVKDYVAKVRSQAALIAAQQEEIQSLKTLIQQSRSPALFSSTDDFLTERLLAHPAIEPLPPVRLSSRDPEDKPNRVAIAQRLLKAYHRALEAQTNSPMKQQGEDLWTGLLRNELPELLTILERQDPERLANYLTEFGRSFVWFGGITTCVDGYNRNLDPGQVALTYFDKLVCLAEYLGISRFESPESGPWGATLHSDLESLITAIEAAVGIDIFMPLGIIHTDGLETSRGLLHYRHINALYCAIRIAALNPHRDAVCEFGGGLGLTAAYARRLRITDYTIFDLPVTCLLAGHYLIHALGEAAVCLYGEEPTTDSVKILPYWECVNTPDKTFDVTVNQDSLPEISDDLIADYLQQIKRLTRRYFFSINHECFSPRTVKAFVETAGGYAPLYRSRYWVREGYLEEVFNIL